MGNLKAQGPNKLEATSSWTFPRTEVIQKHFTTSLLRLGSLFAPCSDQMLGWRKLVSPELSVLVQDTKTAKTVPALLGSIWGTGKGKGLPLVHLLRRYPANHIFESSFLRSWSCCSCWQRQEGQEGTKQFPQHCSWVCSILPTLLLQRTTQPNTNNFRTRAAQRNQRKRTFGCELVGDVVSTSSSISYADSQLPVHTQASICTWSAEFEVASNLKTLHVPPGVWEKSGTRNEKVESMQTNLYCISIIQHLYVDNVKTFGSYVMWSRKCAHHRRQELQTCCCNVEDKVRQWITSPVTYPTFVFFSRPMNSPNVYDPQSGWQRPVEKCPASSSWSALSPLETFRRLKQRS